VKPLSSAARRMRAVIRARLAPLISPLWRKPEPVNPYRPDALDGVSLFLPAPQRRARPDA
jgi:hypothetical protein